MRTVNIYLLRHGKTLGEPALNGHTDVEVASKIQHSICNDVLRRLPSIESIVSSPLRRCHDLATRLVDENPALSLEVSAPFQEMNFGQFDGVPFEQLKEHWPILDLFWQDPANNPLPDAESLEAFYHRVKNNWRSLSEQATQDTLLIAHGGSIRMILASVLGLDWKNPALFSTLQIANQSLSHIKITHSDQIYTQVCSIGAPLSVE